MSIGLLDSLREESPGGGVMIRSGRLYPRRAFTVRRASRLLAAGMSSLLILSVSAASPVSAAVQNYSGISTFMGIACTSANECLGVGNVIDGSSTTASGASASLSETTGVLTSGRSIQVIAGTELLEAVACSSAAQCLGVGQNSGGLAVAVPLNPATGTVSSGQSVQSISGIGSLDGVVCPSATQCLGIGTKSGQGVAVAVPLNPATGVISNGQSVQSIMGLATLAGMACSSSTQCVGVGEGASYADSGSVPLDPATGTISSGQSAQSLSTDANLLGIACSTATQCLAVGWGASGPSVAVPINPATGAVSAGQGEQIISSARVAMGSVACSTMNQCLAVGNDGADPSIGSAVSLNPTTGAVSGSQNVEPVPGAGDLDTAACPSSTECLAAGSAFEARGSVVVTLNAQTGTHVPSGPYSPLDPLRICDTRTGNPSSLAGAAAQCTGLTLQAGSTRTIDVAGAFGVPNDATTVTLNVTVVNALRAGYLSAFPAGAEQPTTASVNFASAEVVGNLIEVGLGSNGEVSIFSSSATDVVVDLEGYTASTASAGVGAGLFDPLSPVRICDTRAGNPSSLSGGDGQCNGTGNSGERLSGGGTQTIQVATNNGIPAGAIAVVLNVTVVNPAGNGYVTVFSEGAQRPVTANVNFQTGQTTGNRVVVPLSTTGATPGQVAVFSSQATDLVIDVSGYYTSPGGSGSVYTSVGPAIRICDTRAGNPSTLSGPLFQCVGKTIGPASTLVVDVAPLAAVPADAKDVMVNITAVDPTLNTFLTVFPDAPRPLAADLNPVAGEIKGNLTIAPISANGTISIYNNAGTVDVVLDVLGWYS
jgi:hypothetical protein